MGCSVQDTFFVDPRVEGCDGLSSRAKRLGLRVKGFLGEGVTVCVAASASGGAGGGGGKGGNEGAGEKTAGAGTGAGLSRGQRLSRIHRMVTQAQTEPAAEAGPGPGGGRRQGHPCIADQARQLRATVLSGKAFGLWLERQESKRAAPPEGGATGATAAAGSRGAAAARPLIPRGQRAAASRFKSQEHPRVVMKDLDGLEPDRVQAFPPELLRKCNLHTDAPPGICPFIPREQWDREVTKMKKKDATCGAAKVAARMPPPAGAQKPRRGGWCECCERQYIGTMSEHCASYQHRTAVAADPNYAVLLELVTLTGSDDESLAQSAAHGPTAAAAAAAAAAGAAGIGTGRGNVTSTVATGAAGAPNVRGEGRKRSLAAAAAAGSEPTSLGGRGRDAEKPGAPTRRESPSHRRRGVPPPARRHATSGGGVVNAKQDTSTTREVSALRDAASSSSGLRDAAGARAGARVLRTSPRRHPKPGQQTSLAPRSEAGGGRRGRRGECVSPEAKVPPSVEQPPGPGSLKRMQGGGSYSRSGDAIPSREAVASTPPQQSTAIVRTTRSSPLPCSSSTSANACVAAMMLGKDASGLRKSSGGVGSPAAAAADTPATSVVSDPSSLTDRSKRSSSSSSSGGGGGGGSAKARRSPESSSCAQARDSAFSPSSSRRVGGYPRRRGSSPGRSPKGETAGSRSEGASPAAGADVARRNSRASHGVGVEACSSTKVSGGSGSLPSGQMRRTDSMDAGDQQHQPTHPARRVAERKPSSDDKKDEVRIEKATKRQRMLKSLADSPEFHGSGPSPAASGSASRVRTCDARGRSVTASGSGSRRGCSRDHRDGGGSATKKMDSNNSGKACRTDNRGGAPPEGSRNEDGRRLKKNKRARQNENEAGGSPSSTYNGSPRESGAAFSYARRYPTDKAARTVVLIGGRMEQDAASASGDGGRTARGGRGGGCDSSPDAPREEERLKSRASLSAGSRGACGGGSGSRGGTRNRGKRRASSTAGRMGLETAGDSSDDSEDADPQSSPLSSDRSEWKRSVPRSLSSRFSEDRGCPTAPAARRRHAAVGENSGSGPPGKRARATLSRPPRRNRA